MYGFPNLHLALAEVLTLLWGIQLRKETRLFRTSATMSYPHARRRISCGGPKTLFTCRQSTPEYLSLDSKRSHNNLLYQDSRVQPRQRAFFTSYYRQVQHISKRENFKTHSHVAKQRSYTVGRCCSDVSRRNGFVTVGIQKSEYLVLELSLYQIQMSCQTESVVRGHKTKICS